MQLVSQDVLQWFPLSYVIFGSIMAPKGIAILLVILSHTYGHYDLTRSKVLGAMPVFLGVMGTSILGCRECVLQVPLQNHPHAAIQCVKDSLLKQDMA